MPCLDDEDHRHRGLVEVDDRLSHHLDACRSNASIYKAGLEDTAAAVRAGWGITFDGDRDLLFDLRQALQHFLLEGAVLAEERVIQHGRPRLRPVRRDR